MGEIVSVAFRVLCKFVVLLVRCAHLYRGLNVRRFLCDFVLLILLFVKALLWADSNVSFGIYILRKFSLNEMLNLYLVYTYLNLSKDGEGRHERTEQ